MFTRLFKPNQSKSPVGQATWPLSMKLLNLGSAADPMTLAEAVEGVVIFGETGSGKSSSLSRSLARAYLGAGFGALVLCVKPDEVHHWERLCAECGREDDLRVFSAEGPYRLNFLDFESRHGGGGAGETENLVALLTQASQSLSRSGGAGNDGSEEGGFWRQNEERLCRNEIQLLQLAGLPISVSNVYRVLSESPQSPDEAASEAMRSKSFTFHCLTLADRRVSGDRERHDLGVVADYWLRELPAMSAKTRSVIVASHLGMLDILNRGRVRELMGEATNLSPADCLAGRIVVVDLNLKQWGPTGLLVQSIWKLLFQRCVERRAVDDNTRPVVLWADEFHHFSSTADALFQSTCRSSRCCTTYLTQGLPGLHSALGGGEKGKAETAMLLGNLGLKVFHANSCEVTNTFASNLIGRTKQWTANVSSSSSRQGLFGDASGTAPMPQDSAGCSEVFEYEFPPHQFATLRSGGFENQLIVDAIAYRGKRLFRDVGRNWRHLSFLQR